MTKSTDAPRCRICDADHWAREPHVFKDSPGRAEDQDVATAKPLRPPKPDVLATLRARVQELEAKADAADGPPGNVTPAFSNVTSPGNVTCGSCVTLRARVEELESDLAKMRDGAAARVRAYRERRAKVF